jgi:multiple sugar transport system ATP-binding protein
MAGLRIASVSRRFGAHSALDCVSFEVADGEFAVVVGPSGCGKSTLLRAVAGLEEIEDGSILLGGEDVAGWPPAERDVAFVFQTYALYPHLTVRQNLEFPLKARGVKKAERDRRAGEAAELLGITDLLDRKPRELSGGQRQRVAIGRAVVRSPKIFLFDEPLSNLDARLRGRMRIELAELQRRLKATVLYVTHDQAEAMTLGDKVIVMDQGKVRQVGRPREVYDRPADTFVAGFVGSPPMNLLEGEVRQSADGRVFRMGEAEWPAPAHLSEGPAVLGVRPEDLIVGEGTLRARVRFVEDLGAERFVYAELAGVEVVARASDGATLPSPGASVELGIRADREHWFRDGRRT